MYSLVRTLEALIVLLIIVVVLVVSLNLKLDYSIYGGKYAFKNFKKSLWAFLILSFLVVVVPKLQFYYMQTKMGKEECISKAEEYLNEIYLNNKYEIKNVKSNGDIEYTVYTNDIALNKEVQIDTYMNYKKVNEDSFWFIPWVTTIR